MAINFPISPTLNQTYTFNGRTWTWNGVGWQATTPPVLTSLTIGTQQTAQGSLVLANTAAGAYSTTLQSSNSASAAYTITLPVSAGSSGQVLSTNGSGVTSWAVNGMAVNTTIQKLTSGSSATYTPTSGARFIRVTIKGGGGGGGSTATSGSTGMTAGGSSTFNSVGAAGGGAAGSWATAGVGGTGGSDNSLVVARTPGESGQLGFLGPYGATNFSIQGGQGGGQGGGAGGQWPSDIAGNAGVANSGGGGGGSTEGSVTQASTGNWYLGNGGGEGETAVVWLPATTYTYTVGAGGSGAAAGTGGLAGGAGGSGLIFVEEFY
jgi:hypothetical protein